MTALIVTVTPNPVVDVATTVDELVPDRKLRCSAMRLEPGGGGINCARVVDELGGAAHAVYAAGGATGRLLDDLLDERGVARTRVDTPERSRLGVHVSVDDADEQYRLTFPGPELDEAVADALLEAVTREIDTSDDGSVATWVIGSGSLPPGFPDDFWAALAERVRDRGAALVLDTAGPRLRPALEVGVTLLRNNQREFAELVGEELDQPEARVRALRSLVDSGAADIAVMGLGSDGSLAVTGDDAWTVTSPEVDVVSAVGAGDSLTAALTLGLARGESLEEATILGVAAGAAAVITPGTGLCRADDTARLVEELKRADGAR